MGAVNKRIYLELLALRIQHEALLRENERLEAQNRRMAHECRLAYLEGLDQGRAELQEAS